MIKQIKSKDAARALILKGINIAADAAKVTHGPEGKIVMIDKEYGTPDKTKDGYTVIKSIFLENQFENMGVKLIKEVSSKTNDVAGDGTTLSAILSQAIANEGVKLVAAKISPVEIKKGIEQRVKEVVDKLKEISKPISSRDEIKQIATISANDEEIGEAIADAMYSIGENGVITIEDGQSFGIEKEVVEGMKIDKGYISPYMVTDPSTMKSEMNDVSILLTDKKISNIQDILPLLEKLLASGKRDIVIIAEDIEGDALSTLILNRIQGTFNALCVKSPGFGEHKKELLEDIAILTGGKVVSDSTGISFDKMEISDLGSAHRIVSTKEDTLIVGGKGSKEDINARVSSIKSEIEKTESKFDKERLSDRVAKLSGGIAIIKVGAATESELKEKKYRVEDALNATKAAVEEGVVPGGGLALLVASYGADFARYEEKDAETSYGARIINAAILEPFMSICANAGVKGDLILQNIISKNGLNGKYIGYDASKCEYVDMIDTGIIDPTKVIRTALENASSVIITFLMTDYAIVEKKEEKKEPESYRN